MKTLFTPLKTLSCAAVSLLAACASSNPSGTPDGYYRVQSGDTLNRIAMRFNQTPAVLAKWNNLSDPSKISVGQLLRVRQNAGGKGGGVHRAYVLSHLSGLLAESESRQQGVP